MTETTERPDWLFEGAELAVFSQGRSATNDHVKPVTVERILKRDIVCTGDERFRLDRYFATEGRYSRYSGGTWGRHDYLLPLTDERVVQAYKTRRILNAKYGIDTAFEHWQKDRTDMSRVTALIKAAHHYEKVVESNA